MFNKKNFIILVIIINMIMSVCASMNVFAAANLAVYTSVAPTLDSNGNIWIYFGTGDKTDPGSTTSGHEKLYAIKDSDRTSTYTLSNFMDISGDTSYPVYDPTSTTYHGYYITLSGTAEKILAAPVVYDQKVYFTTYTPSSVACDQNGIAKLYVINYLTGAGELSSGSGSGSGTSSAGRSENVGYGIPAGAVISSNPYNVPGGGSGSGSGSGSGGTGSGTVVGYNVFVSTSAANYGTGSNTTMPNDPSPQSGRGKYMIYWKDNRLQ